MAERSTKSSLLNKFSVEVLSDEICEELKKKYSAFSDGAIRLNPGGWMFPGKYLDYAHHFHEFDYSENDIIVLTFAKAGTTWMTEIIWNLINNPDQNNPHSYLSTDLRCPLMEAASIFTAGGRILEMDFGPYMKHFDEVFPGCRKERENSDTLTTLYGAYEDMPTPRVLKMHHPIPLLPENLLKKSKIVYVARNFYDMVNSFFHFIRFYIFGGNNKLTMDEVVDDFIADKCERVC